MRNSKSAISFITTLLLFIAFTISSPLQATGPAKAKAPSTEAAQGANQTSPKTAAPNILILLGAPGSGKGTQAVKLSEQLKIPHISTGDLFRENIKNNTKLGQEAKSYIDSGKLVPDSLTAKLLKDRLSKPDTKYGYILDGYPRNVEQAKDLSNIIPKNAKVSVFYLDVSDNVLMERIMKRAQESGVKRSDDTPEIAKERIKVYHEQTAPVINYYQEKGLLKKVDGEKGPDYTNEQIMATYTKAIKDKIQ